MGRQVFTKSMNWIIGMAIILTGAFLLGCSEQRWHPTDPRLDTPNLADVQVVERWEIGVNVDVQN